MSFTWNGTTLPKCATDGISIKDVGPMSEDRMLDGGLRRDILATKYEITINWRYITESDYSTLKSLYASLIATAATLVLDNGDSYSVMPSDFSPQMFYMGASARRYHVSIVFREV